MMPEAAADGKHDLSFTTAAPMPGSWSHPVSAQRPFRSVIDRRGLATVVCVSLNPAPAVSRKSGPRLTIAACQDQQFYPQLLLCG